MWRDGRGRSQVCAVQLFPRAQHFAYLNALNLPSNPLHTQAPTESQLYSNRTRSIKHSKESWQRVVPPRPSRSRNRYTLCLFCTYLPILPHSQMTAEDSHATSTVLYRRLFIQYFLFFILTASVDFQIPSSHYLSLLRLYVPACDSLCVQQAQMVSTIMLIYRS